MKVVGITAEYNPFHNGHQYNIAKARELAQADFVVVAMSGNFMQRGEAAFIDKWARSKCAIKCGADLVIEIPFTFACSRAEHYARGAVDVLVAAGVTHIAFGCESSAPEKLTELVADIEKNQEEIKALADGYMKTGLSSAKANELAVAECLGKEAAELMLQPNNILAIEYIRRINYWNEAGRCITSLPIKRIGSGYYQVNYSEGFAGATEIRKIFNDSDAPDFAALEKLMPEVSLEIIREQMGSDAPKGRHDRMMQKLYELLRYEIIRCDEAELSEIYGIGEGIENRMKRAVVKATSFEEFLQEMVSKRYTAAAIRRMVINILMGIKKGTGPENSKLEYLRILAVGKEGRKFVKEGKKNELFMLPLITNMNRDGEGLDLSRDVKASDLYNILYGRNLYSCSDRVVTPYVDL